MPKFKVKWTLHGTAVVEAPDAAAAGPTVDEMSLEELGEAQKSSDYEFKHEGAEPTVEAEN